MGFNFVDKSQLWSGIAVLMFGSGTIVGIGAMVTAEEIGDAVLVETRGNYVTVVTERISPATGCSILSVVDASEFSWVGDYSYDSSLRKGQSISNLDHCAALLEKFPEAVQEEGGEVVTKEEFRESENGSVVETSFEYDRDWARDLGRRLLLLMGGVLIGFVAALPWIAVYQVTRRLEEIRDKSR